MKDLPFLLAVTLARMIHLRLAWYALPVLKYSCVYVASPPDWMCHPTMNPDWLWCGHCSQQDDQM